MEKRHPELNFLTSGRVVTERKEEFFKRKGKQGLNSEDKKKKSQVQGAQR